MLDPFRNVEFRIDDEKTPIGWKYNHLTKLELLESNNPQ